MTIGYLSCRTSTLCTQISPQRAPVAHCCRSSGMASDRVVINGAKYPTQVKARRASYTMSFFFCVPLELPLPFTFCTDVAAVHCTVMCTSPVALVSEDVCWRSDERHNQPCQRMRHMVTSESVSVSVSVSALETHDTDHIHTTIHIAKCHALACRILLWYCYRCVLGTQSLQNQSFQTRFAHDNITESPEHSCERNRCIVAMVRSVRWITLCLVNV